MPTPEQQAVIEERDALGRRIAEAEASLPALLGAIAVEGEAEGLAADHEALRRRFQDLNEQIKEFD